MVGTLHDWITIMGPIVSIIGYFLLLISKKWDYKTISLSFIFGLIIGAIYGSFTNIDSGIFLYSWSLALAWYIFYKAFKETLKLEAHDGRKASGFIWLIVVIGIFAPASNLLYFLGGWLVLGIIELAVPISDIFKPGSLVSMTLIIGSTVIPMFVAYKVKIKEGIKSFYESALFDNRKISLLLFGLICSLIVFISNYYTMYIQWGGG